MRNAAQYDAERKDQEYKITMRRKRVLELRKEGVDIHEANAIARKEYPIDAHATQN